MALPWVRLDANIASHDKILALISDPSAKKWQAISSYMFALGWSGGHATDGFVPVYALADIKATTQTARLLVKYGLWEEALNGWWIKNFYLRQETSEHAEAKRKASAKGGRKSACIKNHGPNCGCWDRDGDSK